MLDKSILDHSDDIEGQLLPEASQPVMQGKIGDS